MERAPLVPLSQNLHESIRRENIAAMRVIGGLIAITE
jgi:hypothetical protein